MFDTLIVTPLVNALMAVYAVVPGHDFGVAVIVVTLVIRFALWPFAAKQLHSQRAMQKLAPEISKIKKQAKGDRQKESQMLMELYKEKGISPFGSITPLLIQLPLFIAFYYAIRNAVHAADVARLVYPSIRQLPAIQEIIQHPAQYVPTFLGFIQMAKPNVIIAIAAALGQYFQTKQLLPKQVDKKDATARATQMTALLFPFLTFLFALSLPSALALYWFTASIVAIIQQTIMLRKDEKEMEEIK